MLGKQGRVTTMSPATDPRRTAQVRSQSPSRPVRTSAMSPAFAMASLTGFALPATPRAALDWLSAALPLDAAADPGWAPKGSPDHEDVSQKPATPRLVRHAGGDRG